MIHQRQNKFKMPIYIDGKFSSWHYWGFCDEIEKGAFVSPHSDYRSCPSFEYIGIQDIEGVDIYEEDLVSVVFPDTPHAKGRTIIGIIEYDAVGARFQINEIVNDDDCYDYHNIHEDLSIKVIGHNLFKKKSVK